MKPQGSSTNKPGSKYSPAPVIYNRALFKTGATDLPPRQLASTSDSMDRSTLGWATQHIPERLIILLTNLTVKLSLH